jgi:hypothetical protein
MLVAVGIVDLGHIEGSLTGDHGLLYLLVHTIKVSAGLIWLVSVKAMHRLFFHEMVNLSLD